VSDFQKQRQAMTAARRARERQYSEQAVSNLGTAAGTAFNNAAELQKRINPVSLPAQMMAKPAIAEAGGLLSDKVIKPALNTLTSSVFGDKPFGEMPIQMPRMAGGNRIMPNLQTREVDAMAVPNLVASEAGVPLNFVGAPLFAKGSKMINKIAGPDSGRGMFLSSLSNFIPGYYGGNAGGAVAKWAPENLA